MKEFEIIRNFFRVIGEPGTDIELGIGDDAALIVPPPGKLLCLSIDTLVEGVHFLADASPQTIASRAFGSALSDLAAMAAIPSHFTLSITIPSNDVEWIKLFSKELSRLSIENNVCLIGGDTTRGLMSLTIQAHGWVEPGRELRRAGASVGDLLYVSGTLGDAGAGLDCDRRRTDSIVSEDTAYLIQRFRMPSPRLSLGPKLGGVASSCIDISDGLLADAEHLSDCSRVGFEIDLSKLPLSNEIQKIFPERALELALTAGDDYELLFTVPPKNADSLDSIDTDCELTCIGRAVEGTGIELQGVETETLEKFKAMSNGYDHFG